MSRKLGKHCWMLGNHPSMSALKMKVKKNRHFQHEIHCLEWYCLSVVTKVEYIPRIGFCVWVYDFLNVLYISIFWFPGVLSWFFCYFPCFFSSSIPVRARIQQEMKKDEDHAKCVLVNGAGFLCPFYFGILDFISTLRESKRNRCLPLDKTKFYGISAGNFAVLAQFLMTTEVRDSLLEQATGRALNHLGWGLFGNLSWLREFLLEVCPEDAYLRMRNKHVVVVGKWPGSVELLSNFQSNEDYIDAILCSCAIPGFVWRPFFLNGSIMYDFGPQGHGHFIDDLFDVSFRIRTSKLFRNCCYDNCIYPSKAVGHGFWSRGENFTKWLYNLGKEDAERFFAKSLEDAK